MAFLINAYNAFMVEKILTRHPNIRSIRDFGKVFGDEFFTLPGRKFHLDRIEYETLRKPVASREQWLGRYAHLLADTPEQQTIIRDGKAEPRFLDYDWNLNDARK